MYSSVKKIDLTHSSNKFREISLNISRSDTWKYFSQIKEKINEIKERVNKDIKKLLDKWKKR